jgi:hypothetical protein
LGCPDGAEGRGAREARFKLPYAYTTDAAPGETQEA